MIWGCDVVAHQAQRSRFRAQCHLQLVAVVVVADHHLSSYRSTAIVCERPKAKQNAEDATKILDDDEGKSQVDLTAALRRP